MTRRAFVASLALALIGARAAAEAPTSFDYLYIRAHENSASGGHAAIRFGPDTFDFQHADDGWLAVRRESSRRFQHEYRTLQNRSIEVSRIEAAPETVALLRDTFERRVLAQSRQLARLGEMEGDVALLDALAAGEEAPLPVRGAGFFADEEGGGAAPSALAELRARIAARYGADWLEGRREAALQALRDLTPTPPDPGALPVDPLRYPVARESLSRRSARALAALRACEVILRPRGLRDGVRAGEGRAPDAWLRLDDALRARLLEARAGLLDAAAALAASRRPDWGEALLLASARLVALDESLAAGHLVMLDAFPSDTKVLRVGSRRRALLPTLLGEARRDFAEAHQCLFANGGYREETWSELEAAVTRIAELRAVEAGAENLRIAVGAMLPEGVAQIPLPPRDAALRIETASAAQVARGALQTYRGALEAQYRYHLLERNCVSELFRTIEAGLASVEGAPPAADRVAIREFVRRESVHRLGGYVDPVADANFIPFVSSRNVRASWRVSEQLHLASAREHAVESEGGFAAALRESNVLTSSVYEPSEDAGFFLFFTDGEWPLRPLLGAANLVAAVARTGVGVLQVPFDRGRGVLSGLDGALWSVPELFFTNIRKGTNEYVPPAQRPPAD